MRNGYLVSTDPARLDAGDPEGSMEIGRRRRYQARAAG